MKKTILKIVLNLKIWTTIGILKVYASYEIPPEYRPSNEPFYKKIEDIPLPEDQMAIVLQIIADALLYFAAPLAIVMIGFVAFSMVMGGADNEKLEQSKKHLLWLIIGLLLIILSFSLVKIAIGFHLMAVQE